MSVLTEDFDYILSRVTPRFKHMAGTRLVLTGAAGFVGAYLMDFFRHANAEFFDAPCTVYGLDNFTAASRKVGDGNSVYLYPEECEDEILRCRPEWFVHAASIASPRLYMTYPLTTIEANVHLTERMLKEAHLAKTMLYLSSSEVYGDPSVIPTPETYWGNTSFTGPRAVYDESKRFAETLCQVYFRHRGVPVVIARPFNLYGPGQSLNDGRVVPAIMRAALKSEEFVVYGGTATRSFCYVADAVVQLLSVLLDGLPGEAYNVGDSASELTINELAIVANRLFDLKIKTLAEHQTLIDAPNRRRPDTTKILSLGAKPPSIALVDGLRRTHVYYLEENGIVTV